MFDSPLKLISKGKDLALGFISCMKITFLGICLSCGRRFGSGVSSIGGLYW